MPGVQQLLGQLTQFVGIDSGINHAAEPFHFKLLAGAEFDLHLHQVRLIHFGQAIGQQRSGRNRRYTIAGSWLFQLVTLLAVLRNCQEPDLASLQSSMRLSWPQHLQTARLLEGAADAECGIALALMGVSLLILVEDLLEQELLGTTQRPGPG